MQANKIKTVRSQLFEIFFFAYYIMQVKMTISLTKDRGRACTHAQMRILPYHIYGYAELRV